MENTDELLLQYEHADMDKRMSLFLTYRDLRDVFMEIELNSVPSRRGAEPDTA